MRRGPGFGDRRRDAVSVVVATLLFTMRAATTSVAGYEAPSHAPTQGRTHPDSTSVFQNMLRRSLVWAVRGLDAELSCNATPSHGDRVLAIFWYRGAIGSPLLSLDARKEKFDLKKLSHLSESSSLGGRAYLRIETSQDNRIQAVLHIVPVIEEDEGEFRCRVDFSESPTSNSRVQLKVIEPPEPPIILDERGAEVATTAGPFREGFELQLLCRVEGGRPRPRVEWWLGKKLVDSSVDYEQETWMVNRLVVGTVTRALVGAQLECRAVYSSLAPPLTRAVSLDIQLKPLDVRLKFPGDTLSAGRYHRFVCDVWGSVPPARIVWLLNGEVLRGFDISETQAPNATSSILNLRLHPVNDGSQLTCRAENSAFRGLLLEDQRELLVSYAPEVSVEVSEVDGRRPDPEPTAEVVLREGTSAILKCKVRSRPEPHYIAWFHQGDLLERNDSASVLPQGRLLQLGHVASNRVGEYYCVAANLEGETRSKTLRLVVHYAPRCAPGTEQRRVGAMPGRPVTAHCEVDAAPGGDDVRFHWTEGDARGTALVAATRVRSQGSRSQVAVEARGATDAWPELRCYAANSVGQQRDPCVVVVVPARRPEPPTDCFLRNSSRGRVEVRCSPADDGDLPQYFLLEVREQAAAPPPLTPPLSPPLTPPIPHSNAHSSGPLTPISTAPAPALLNDEAFDSGTVSQGAPLYRRLGAEPFFVLDTLQPHQAYQLAVFAENEKGRSEPPVLLYGVQVAPPLVHLPPTEESSRDVEESAMEGAMQPTPIILAVVICSAVLLLGGMLATATFLACRKRHPRPLDMELASEVIPYPEHVDVSESVPE